MTLLKNDNSSPEKSAYNPFVKTGDIILLKNREGKFIVIEADINGIKAVPEKSKDLESAAFYSWEDFAGWRSK